MSVLYTGTEMVVMERLTAALAEGDGFQAFSGTSTDEAAKAVITEMDGEILTVAHALIYPPRLPLRQTPGGAMRGTLSIEMHFGRPQVAGDTEAETLRRAWNELSAIRTDLVAAFGRNLLALDPIEPVVCDLSDAQSGWVDFGLEAQFGVVL